MIKLFLILATVLVPARWIYVVDDDLCSGCGNCLNCCPHGAISMVGGNAYINPEQCTGCGLCPNYCSRGAISMEWYTGIEDSLTGVSHPAGLALSSNPAAAGILAVSGVEPAAEIAVVDLSGRLVTSANADNSGEVALDASGLSPGTYLLISGGSSATLTVAGSI